MLATIRDIDDMGVDTVENDKESNEVLLTASPPSHWSLCVHYNVRETNLAVLCYDCRTMKTSFWSWRSLENL